jgi:uncharacterized protein (TIGR02145 family)
MKNPIKILAAIMPVFMFFACNEADIPVVTTTAITDISTTTAVSGGVIANDGGGAIIEKGVCWDTIDKPKIDKNIITDTVELLSFTCKISGLSPNTKYYVRAFATNIAGTGYGNSESFTTLGNLPSMGALVASNIETHSVTLNGSVNPNLLSTTVDFEYGTSTSYGNSVASAQIMVSGDADVSVSADLAGLTPGTTYHFRVKAENSLGTMYSSDMTFTTLGQVPSAVSEAVSGLKINTVKLNGSVNPNYLPTIVTFEWGTSISYGNTLIPSSGSFTGSTSVNVSSDLAGLTAGTTYHFRIKAVNELGTTTGDDLTFKTYVVADADNNYYYSVTIGSQIWMLENLKTTHYKDGTSIPLVTDNTAWKNLSAPGYCWYSNNETTYKTTYGAIYNWYTVNTGKICPAGWHVPTNGEWVALTNYLGGESVAGNKLKESGSIHWGDINAGTNETGFTALPGGSRIDDGTFSGIGLSGLWWSASASLATTSYYAILYHNSGNLVRGGNLNVYGLSIRCAKD